MRPEEIAEGTILTPSPPVSGAHAWRSSITPIDQLLCQAGHFLMSCDKTQWNKNQYRGNKLLIAVWDFYLRAGRGWKDWSYERGEAVAFQLSDFYEVYCGLQPLQDRMDYPPCLLYLRGTFCALACVCLRSDSLRHSGSLSSQIPLVEDSEFSTVASSK